MPSYRESAFLSSKKVSLQYLQTLNLILTKLFYLIFLHLSNINFECFVHLILLLHGGFSLIIFLLFPVIFLFQTNSKFNNFQAIIPEHRFFKGLGFASASQNKIFWITGFSRNFMAWRPASVRQRFTAIRHLQQPAKPRRWSPYPLNPPLLFGRRW